MKKALSLILALVMVFSLAACASSDKSDKDNKQSGSSAATEKNDYTLSDSVPEESIIDGVMTDIPADDPVLKKTTASWLDTCVLYEVNIRQFTEEGTFAAFEEHLDRLKDMGVNTLWLMPIHPISEKERKGTLGSYYAVTDYRAVNPEFGTMDDFNHLLDKAHGMGFKVILDWVANHTGWDCAWLSEHDDWYAHNASGEIDSPYDWTDVAQLNYDNYEMRAEMIDCMRYWIEDVGVDGFRCDHAVGVPAPFWNAAVYKLKSVNSEIMMLAEASANLPLTGYAFDTCYNDPLYSQLGMVRGGIGLETIRTAIGMNDRYAEGSFPMNYLDNHDKNTYEGSVVARLAKAYPAVLGMIYIAPGIPLLYTSDEQGYDHEIEFFEKDTVKWDDEPAYAPAITVLSGLKADHEALASTNKDLSFLDSENSSIFAFTRSSGDDTVIYIANLFYEDVKDAGVKADFDTAECVLHYDGTSFDTEAKEMTAEDFEKRTWKPYEFYVLTVG